MRITATLALACMALAATAARAETPVGRGSYLVNSIGNCHSPHDPGYTMTGPALSRGVVSEEPAFVATAPNLTADRDTGIGAWTDAEIAAALTRCVRPDGRQLAYPMPWPWLATMHGADVSGVIAYLRTLPPVRRADG